MRLCPWSLALASSVPVLGLERFCPRKGCPWPWPRNFFVSLASSLVSSTPPLLKAVVGRSLLTSSRAPTIQSRRGHQCGVSKGSALRFRLTGSVVQPRVSYDLLNYKAIGSNYLSFVVTSMLVFHIATG